MNRLAWVVVFGLFGCSANSQTPIPFDQGLDADAASPSAPVSSLARADYPAGPYGALAGATIENLGFLGWQSPAAANYDPSRIAPIHLSDFYDPTGEKHTPYLVITSTALWCSACKLEYTDMKGGNADAYERKGVAFLGALFEDNAGDPAQPRDLATWAKAYSVKFPFVLDPALKLGAFFDVNGTPMEMIVDTRTMRILKVEEGWTSTAGTALLWTQMDQLLAKSQ